MKDMLSHVLLLCLVRDIKQIIGWLNEACCSQSLILMMKDVLSHIFVVMSDNERHAVSRFVAMSGDRHVVSHFVAMSGDERPFAVSHFVADK